MEKLIVDSFAGGGGASTGIEMALGRSPDIAINHSADALAMHAVNHPDTLHLDSNIWDVSPREVTKGRPVGLLWASPDCKHFSKAKGGKPLDRNIRDLAWVVVRWAEEVAPDVILLENVEEFRTWGPIYEDGTAIAQLRGQTFEDWKRRLKKAGYRVQHRELRACDYGAPTIRKRLFLIARRDGLPIVWPARTHGDPKKPEDARLIARGRLKPWRTAAEIIDWSLPCPSIFDSAAEIFAKHGVRAVRPLAEATMKRIARGVVRYVLEAKKPFVVHASRAAPHPSDAGPPAGPSDGLAAYGAPFVSKFQTGSTGHAIDEPLATVTANSFVKRPGGAAPLGVVVPSIVRTDMASAATRNGVHSPEDPLNTLTTSGSFAVVAPVVTAAQHGGSVRPVDHPLHTIAASPKDQNAVIVPSLVGCGGRAGQSAPRGGDEPLGTLTAKADGCVVAAHLTKSEPGGIPEPQGEEDDYQGDSRCSRGVAGSGHTEDGRAERAEERNDGNGRTEHDARLLHPLRTADSRRGGAAALLIQTGYGEREGQEPRALDIERPLGTQVAGGAKHALAAVHMSRFTQNGVGSGADEPVDTVMAGAPKFGVVAAFLAQHNTDNPGHDAREPVSTLTAGGQGGVSQQGVVAAHLMNMRGSARRDSSVDEPARTVTSGGNHAALISGFLTKYYGQGDGAAVGGPLHTDTTKDRFGLVTVSIDGETFFIADIGMRMLTPRERFRAQGFPDSYVIDRRPDGSAITATVQGSCCGNSVCPPLAAALVAANCGHLARIAEAAE